MVCGLMIASDLPTIYTLSDCTTPKAYFYGGFVSFSAIADTCPPGPCVALRRRSFRRNCDGFATVHWLSQAGCLTAIFVPMGVKENSLWSNDVGLLALALAVDQANFASQQE